MAWAFALAASRALVHGNAPIQGGEVALDGGDDALGRRLPKPSDVLVEREVVIAGGVERTAAAMCPRPEITQSSCVRNARRGRQPFQDSGEVGRRSNVAQIRGEATPAQALRCQRINLADKVEQAE